MSLLESIPKSHETNLSNRQVVPHISRGALLVLVALVYSGGFQFLAVFSPYMLYGCYFVIFSCVVSCLISERLSIHTLSPVMPYIYWLFFYCLWGTLISPIKSVLIKDVVRVLALNVFF